MIRPVRRADLRVEHRSIVWIAKIAHVGVV
jgi:hypothetical protein